MEATFNGKRMLDALSKLQPHQQLVFGAACCERMLANYETFMREAGWGDVEPLRRALDRVWEACEGRRSPEAGLRDLLSQCEKCAPDAEDFTSLYVSSAQDAALAVCALLDFLLDGDLDRLVSVPRLSTDSVDLIVQERENMDPRDPLRERKILGHPLMQQDLVRQKRDVSEAAGISLGDKVAVLGFRSRAQHESNLVVGTRERPLRG